jgi:hypothetical protein
VTLLVRKGCRKGYNKSIQVSFDSNIYIGGVFAISAAHLYQNYLEELISKNLFF